MRLAEALLDRGAGIEKKNHAGATALSFAIIAGKAEVVELLVKRGADMGKAAEIARRFWGYDVSRFHGLRNEERADALRLIMGPMVW